MNEINIKVAAEQDVTDELSDVQKEAQQTKTVIVQAMGSSEEAFDSAARASGKFGQQLDFLSGASSQLSGGIGDIGGSMVAFTDLQKLGTQRALEHQQAMLDAESAQRDYDDAVKEFGKDSLEARQAQLALTAAQEAAKPPTEIQQWGEKLELISPLIMGITGALDLMILANNVATMSWLRNTAAMVGSKIAMVATTTATGIATAAQWAWNIAMTANPIGLIIAAVVALIAVIVLIATKTTFFQDVWKAVWGFVTRVAKDAWEFIKKAVKAGIDFVIDYFKFIMSLPGKIGEAFKKVAEFITAPFRAAFNAIARLWNGTVGRLSFSIPSWVPGIGGHGFSMPNLPTLQTGGEILRTGMAIVHKGEKIQPAGKRGLQSDGERMIVEVRLFGGDEEFRRWFRRQIRVYMTEFRTA